MKKIYLLLVCLVFAGITFGQQQISNNSKAAPSKIQDTDTFSIPDNNFKGDGDVFWIETFNWENPDDIKGWTLPEGWVLGEEGEDFGHSWMWRNDTIGGRFTDVSPRTWFDTPEDGFIVMPIDEYNFVDGVSSNNGVDSWFQTPPIDCSDKPSVVITFYQYFRTCCGGYEMDLMVSNDDGVHWAEYDLRYGTRVNDITLDAGRSVEINITNVAAGNSEVLIRVRWSGSTHYFYIIDDMKLSEAYHNELKLENKWAFFNDGDVEDDEGYINYIPLSQLNESFGSYSFRSAVLNSGVDDQTNVHLNMDVWKNGVSVYNENSPGRDLATLAQDTFNITNEFMADDYGDYLFRFNDVMDLEDQIPDNNYSELLFTVDDSLYMRNDRSAEGAAGNNGYVGALNSGDAVGNVFTITSPVEVNSITAFISTMNLDVESATHSVQYALFKEDLEGDEDYIEILVSEYTELDPDARRYWLTLPLDKDGEAEFLQPGNYIVGCYFFGEGDGVDLRLGYDISTYCPGSKSLAKWMGAETWGGNGKLKMIGIGTTERGGPTIAEVEFNVDMNEQIAGGIFNPASDFVDVSGSFNDWGGSEAFTDADGDGVYSIVIPDIAIGETVEYIYRINANAATAEVENRTYDVRYWNVLDDVYVYSAASAIDDEDLNDKILVYPNPSNGKFNLVVNNKKQSDLIIEMRDVQGQVIYNNTVKSVVKHTEIIDLKLPKGMYFLSVNNGSSMKIKKVVVH